MMKRTMIRVLLAVAIGVTASACADDARAPFGLREAPTAQQTSATLARTSGAKAKLAGMQWRKQLKRDVHASALIGPAGGVLVLPATGLRLVVPAGAVSRPTLFGATALEGKVVAYDFEPAGSVFPVALRVEQDPAFINMKHNDASRMRAGYFPSRSDLDQSRATGDVAELISTSWSAGAVSFSVWHFSGYMMSWGFADPTPDASEPGMPEDGGY
jgi:hypothetical protein